MKKIIVIKIGSSVLLTKRQKVDQYRMKHLAEQVASLKNDGYGIVLVVSGAVAYGSHFIDLSQDTGCHRNVAAGIGQIYVMTALNETFCRLGIQIAQILLTKEYFLRNKKYLKEILESSLLSGFIPVINENDVLDLNSFGGNDLLAAEVAKQLTTEKVYFLSTMKGSLYGVGGATTKIQAYDHLTKRNISARIVNGKKKNVLLLL